MSLHRPYLTLKNSDQHIEAVLFDLDGTLFDTAASFEHTLTQVAQAQQLSVPSTEAVRLEVSNGTRAMVHLLCPHLGVKDPQFVVYRDLFLAEYIKHVAYHVELFDGLDVFLHQLDALNIPWGIVTNKFRAFSEKLLDELGLRQRCSTLVCPDDVSKPKPDPEPMYVAATQLGIDPANIVYVGDHPRDIDAGNAAGMTTVLAGYGYLPKDRRDNLSSWQADWVVKDSREILKLLITT